MPEIKKLADSEIGTESEGYIVHFESGLILKVKGEDYCRIHRLAYSLSNKQLARE
jgi:hypothetical protein